MTEWLANKFSLGEATRLAYMTEEAKEGRNAFLKNVNQISGDNQWIS